MSIHSPVPSSEKSINRPAHILVTDDEPAVRAVLRAGFEAAGFSVIEAASKVALLDALDKKTVDLITLDLGLGSEDGLDAVRDVRPVRNVPIVMISGRAAPRDRVIGLEHGADDYITKPFHIHEVVLRVRNVLKRYGPDDASLEPPVTETLHIRTYTFAGGILDAVTRTLLSASDRPIELTAIQYDLLETLLRNPRRILSSSVLISKLARNDRSVTKEILDETVEDLRSKTDRRDSTPSLIRTVRGVGHVFTGEVSTTDT